jgi:hypothetical protein
MSVGPRPFRTRAGRSERFDFVSHVMHLPSVLWLLTLLESRAKVG